LLGFLQSIAATIVLAAFVITFLVQAFQIPSQSMEETLLVGDYLLVDKVHFANGGIWGGVLPYAPVRRGDIVVFRFPLQPAQYFVKRVVALPGDRVRLFNHHVLVNGVALEEKYAVYRGRGFDPARDNFPERDMVPHMEARWWLEMRRRVHDGELLVPAGAFFVLGDNRDESLDSRYWGFVPQENIVGRPLFIYLSRRSPQASGPAWPDGTLARLAYIVAHPSQFARWERTFRLVQ